MNVQSIQNQVDKLHEQAALKIRNIRYRYRGVDYLFDFNGYDVVCRVKDGPEIATFNTRKLSTAKQWLREYLDN